MKANEIRSMSESELEQKLADLKKDLFMLRMQHATNHLDNPTRISATRRDIARVKFTRAASRVCRRADLRPFSSISCARHDAAASLK